MFDCRLRMSLPCPHSSSDVRDAPIMVCHRHSRHRARWCLWLLCASKSKPHGAAIVLRIPCRCLASRHWIFVVAGAGRAGNAVPIVLQGLVLAIASSGAAGRHLYRTGGGADLTISTSHSGERVSGAINRRRRRRLTKRDVRSKTGLLQGCQERRRHIALT